MLRGSGERAAAIAAAFSAAAIAATFAATAISASAHTAAASSSTAHAASAVASAAVATASGSPIRMLVARAYGSDGELKLHHPVRDAGSHVRLRPRHVGPIGLLLPGFERHCALRHGWRQPWWRRWRWRRWRWR